VGLTKSVRKYLKYLLGENDFLEGKSENYKYVLESRLNEQMHELIDEIRLLAETNKITDSVREELKNALNITNSVSETVDVSFLKRVDEIFTQLFDALPQEEKKKFKKKKEIQAFAKSLQERLSK